MKIITFCVVRETPTFTVGRARATGQGQAKGFAPILAPFRVKGAPVLCPPLLIFLGCPPCHPTAAERCKPPKKQNSTRKLHACLEKLSETGREVCGEHFNTNTAFTAD